MPRYISFNRVLRLNARVYREDAIEVPFTWQCDISESGKKDQLLGSGVLLLSYRHDATYTEYANEGARCTIRMSVWPVSVAFRRITR